MDHARLVRGVQSAGHGHRDAHGLVDGKLLFASDAVAQRLALDERHHVVQDAVGLTGVEQR
jgi:hypothetical protein